MCHITIIRNCQLLVSNRSFVEAEVSRLSESFSNFRRVYLGLVARLRKDCDSLAIWRQSQLRSFWQFGRREGL
jgi:hypothetical protein